MKLDINNLEVRYDTSKIIENFSLHVENGEFVSILGKSGSGKSSLLKSIAGLIPYKGNIIHNNQDLNSFDVHERNIAFVFQQPLLFPHLNVFENIAFGLKTHHYSKEKINHRVLTLLELFQIKELSARMPNQLSGGQQQRVALARSLALNHQLLLMDEPFSSLDPYLKEDMYVLLKDIQKHLNLTILFVTHDVREAIRLSDKIGFLSGGKLIQLTTPVDIYQNPSTHEIKEFMSVIGKEKAYLT